MHKNISNSNFVSAIIVAAGKGTRMNMSINKQFVDLNDSPLLAHTIKVFQNTAIINEIVIVVNEDDIDFVRNSIVEKYLYTKVSKIVAGGDQRQSSVYNGIRNLNPHADLIAIHDGARPFVTSDIIMNAISAAIENSSAICAVKVKDTIKTSSEDGFVDKTLERNCLWSVQTPQVFRSDILVKAHEDAITNGYLGTDDAVLVERIGIKTKIVPGSYNNIKITTKEDLAFAQAIISSL